MMRRRIKSAMLMIIMVCTLCVNSVVAEAESATDSGDRVTILFTHDIHSRLDEYKASQADGETEMIGGLARIKTEIDRVKEEDPAAFVFDAGDFSMGTLYQTIYETDAAELTMLGKIGVEATTFGNHEFDYRAEGLSNMFHSALRNAEEDAELTLPQFLTANIDWKKNKSDDNKLIQTALEDYGSKEYTVIEHDGVQIGVFGVLGEDAAACAPESGLEFDDIVETSKRVVKELQKKDVDMIVCLSHSGTNEDEDKSEDEILAEEVPEIDVIISGHTHTTLEQPIIHGNTVIASAGCYGANLGEMSLVPDGDGRWTLEEYKLKAMDGTVEKDADIEAELAQYRSVIDEEYLSRFGYTMNQVLAENDVAFDSVDDMYAEHREAGLGNLISDSYIYAVKQAEGEDYEPVDLAVVATGVIRDSFPKGEITVSDAFNVSALGIGADRITGYPLVSVYLTGAELKTVAEVDASVSSLMSAAQLYPSGMAWTFNPHRMILNKVTDVYMTTDQVGKEEPLTQEKLENIQDDKLYRVVSGLYSAQMLGAVEGQSKGILKITPKNADGEPITDFEKYIIHDQNGAEVKEWYALASYLESFSENDEGVSVVPERYEKTENRKVINDSRNPIELLKHPNKIALVIYAVILVLILLIVLVVRICYTKIRARKNKKENK